MTKKGKSDISGKGGKKPGKKKPLLSEADKALWEQVTKTVKPLEEKQNFIEEISDIGRPSPAIERRRSEASVPRAMEKYKVKSRETGMRTARGEEALSGDKSSFAPPRAEIARKTQRRIAGGREEISRKIDLHGLTQAEAYAVLKRAVETGVALGQKTLLVVTGKGGPKYTQTEGASAAFRRREDFSPEGGVLKKALPGWLAAELSSFVESYGPAAPGHGGGGAFYVRLRRLGKLAQKAKHKT